MFSSSSNGLYAKVQNYLYLYVPLLTMGIFSREFSTGSIKLLYSSPVSNFSILLSKFLSLVGIGLLLMGILLIYVVISLFMIDNPDTGAMLSGFLGLFLLLISYISIGMFMSSLTSYSVVAALGTLIVFAILNFAGTLWQDVPVVQDICYWLVLKGRADTFISGMITTEDLIYFLAVPAMFLAFTYCVLQAHTKNRPFFQKLVRYVAVFLITAVIGFISSRPAIKKYYDLTEVKRNTLAPASLNVLSDLDQKITVHTYVNMLYQGFLVLPVAYKTDQKRLEQYLRFKPDMELKYHYYAKLPENSVYRSRYPKLGEKEIYDTLQLINDWNVPLQDVSTLKHKELLEQEDFAFLRVLEYEDGSISVIRIYKDLLRLPKELEMTTGFMGLTKSPVKVGVFQKNGERSITSAIGDGIRVAMFEKSARASLVNLGFTCFELDPMQPIPDSTNILLIADPTTPYDEATLKYIDDYFVRGGNVILLTEGTQAAWTNKWLSNYGIQIASTPLTQNDPKLRDHEVVQVGAGKNEKFGDYYNSLARSGFGVLTPGAYAISIDSSSKYEIDNMLLFKDSTNQWHTTAAGITIPNSAAKSKMLVMTDADWLSNDEINKHREGVRAFNPLMLKTAVGWMTENTYPLNIERPVPSDRKVTFNASTSKRVQMVVKYILPVILAVFFFLIFYRRNRK